MHHGPYPRWALHLLQHLAAEVQYQWLRWMVPGWHSQTGSWADWEPIEPDSGLRRSRRSARTLTNLNGAISRHWGWATAGRSHNSCQRGYLPCGMSGSIQWLYECSQLPKCSRNSNVVRSTTRECNVLSAGCHWHNLSVVRWINMSWEPCSGGIPWSNTGGRAIPPKIPPIVGHEACSKEYGEDKFHCTSQLRNHEYRLGQARYRKGVSKGIVSCELQWGDLTSASCWRPTKDGQVFYERGNVVLVEHV